MDLEHQDPQPEQFSSASHSPTLGKIALAMSKAQAEMKAARKTQTNTFHNSLYADYHDIWEVAQVPLANNELAAIHMPLSSGGMGGCRSMIMHSSGEWVACETMFPVKMDKNGDRPATGYGSAISYSRRYNMQALCNIAADEDNDMQDQEKPPVSEEQANTLKALLAEFGDEKKTTQMFCKRMGVDSVDKIAAEDYDKALAAIEQRRQKMKEEK